MDAKIIRLLQIIKKDKPREDHFFKTVASIENPLPYLKPLQREGYFSPEKNPGTIELSEQKGTYTIPHWNVLGYLENVANINNKNFDEEISNTLLEIINGIITYKDQKDKRIDNYRTDWIIGKIILLLPMEKIEDLHFDFIRSTFDSKWDTTLFSSELSKTFLPTLIKHNEKEKTLKLLKIIFDYRKDERRRFDEYSSIMDDYWLKELLDINKIEIAKLYPLEASEIAIQIIESIIDEDKSQFNQVWIPTIEEHEQTKFPDRYEVQLVYFIRDMFQAIEPDNLSEKIKDLLKKAHPIFPRLAIHTINYHYGELGDLLWEIESNPLEIYSIKHELYLLFEAQCKSFTEKQIRKIISWIEGKEYFVSDDQIDNREAIIAYRKKEWLFSLLKSHNSEIQKLFDKYDKINPTELNHPGFDIWSESGWGGEETPLSEAQLLSMTIEQTIKYLNDFVEESGWQKPTVSGLANTLNYCIQNNPQKYTYHLKYFLNVAQVYQKSVIAGYITAWRNEREFEVKYVLEFILALIKADEFWNVKYAENTYNYKDWLISQIVDFINEGVKNDNNAFDIKLNALIEEILLILVDRAEDSNKEILDLITTVLNSTKGKIFSSMVLFSLRYARIVRKNEPEKWLDSIQEDFTKRLDKSVEDSLDFSVVLGQYLPNLYYLNKTWVESNFEKIFPIDNDKYWEASIIGYFYYATNVYSHIYKLLKDNNHFDKAIKHHFTKQSVQERIIEHICVGYLKGWEKLEDQNSLIVKIINSNQTSIISIIIKFFWKQRDNITENVMDIVKPLWRELFSVLDKEKNKDLLADLGKWLTLVYKIDEEIYNWMFESTKYSDVHHKNPFIVDYLRKHVENTPEYVGKLYVNILENGRYPDYKVENIIEIVEIMAVKDQTKLARQICNMYLLKGYDFMRPTLEKIRGE